MDDAGPFILFALFAIAAIAFGIVQSTRTSALPRQWARDNGLRLLACERKTFFRGPFFFRSRKSDKVYRISVEAGEGTVRDGYLRCRASVFGILPDVTEVRWDREPVHRPGFPVIFRDDQ